MDTLTSGTQRISKATALRVNCSKRETQFAFKCFVRVTWKYTVKRNHPNTIFKTVFSDQNRSIYSCKSSLSNLDVSHLRTSKLEHVHL